MNPKIVYVGYNGFPIGFAQVERQRLIAKGLVLKGYEVCVINRYGVHSQDLKIPPSGNSDGILFIYASGRSVRIKPFLKRNLSKLTGLIKELILANSFLKKSGPGSAIIITTNKFYNVLIYALLAKVIGVPSVLDNVEFFSSIDRKRTVAQKINDLLYDRFAFRLTSKVICISDFLINYSKTKIKTTALLKVPVIVDFDLFKKPVSNLTKYFLYCGTASYQEVILFVIDTYEMLNLNNSFYLYLICSGGGGSALNEIKQRIDRSPKRDSIKLFANISYDELLTLYVNSKAMLIPLRNTVQDIARFPHKIGEYSASSAPIISTAIGEVSLYFKDKFNALLINNNDCSELAQKMQFVVDNPEEAKEIGQRGFLTGKNYFDYKKLGEEISRFLIAV